MAHAEEGENANLKTRCGVDIDMMHKCIFPAAINFRQIFAIYFYFMKSRVKLLFIYFSVIYLQ